MSFPFEAQMVYGHEQLQSETKEMPLGTIGVLPDGRKFVYAQASSTSQLDPTYGVNGAMTFVNSAAAAATSEIGDYTVTVTTEESVEENAFEDGYLVVSSGGEKYPMYKIKSHPAADTTTCVITLYEPITTGKAGLVGITSAETITLFPNIYKGVRCVHQEGATDPKDYSPYIGITVRSPYVSASYYCWLQVEGICIVTGCMAFGAEANERAAYFWTDGSLYCCSTALGVVEGRQLAGVVAPTTRFGGTGLGDLGTALDIPGANIPILLQIPH